MTWFADAENYLYYNEDEIAKYEAILNDDGQFYIKKVDREEDEDGQKHDIKFHLFSNGDMTRNHVVSEPIDNECQPNYKKEVTKLDSIENPVLFPIKDYTAYGFNFKANNTEMTFGISRYSFEFSYKTPRCRRGAKLFQTPMYNYQFEEEYAINMARLESDGVFRVYNPDGKVLSYIGQPSLILGHCTMAIEPTDIYANGNVEYYYD